MMRSGRFLLIAPMGILITTFFFAAFALVASTFSLDGLTVYQDILTDKLVLDVLIRTIWLAVVTTAICAVLAYPVALFLARSPNRNLWLIVVVSPWLVSIVVRTFGWMVLLGKQGFVNQIIIFLGAADEPLRLLYNFSAIVVGLVHVLIPFSIIATLSALLQQNRQLEEAGRILGANRFQVFRRITLPLSLHGVLNGASLVLLISAGAIVTPLLLGGLRDRVIGTQIYNEIFKVFNFERATAMAVLLLITSLVLVTPLRMAESWLRRKHGEA